MSTNIKELSLSLVSFFGNAYIVLYNPHSTLFGVRRHIGLVGIMFSLLPNNCEVLFSEDICYFVSEEFKSLIPTLTKKLKLKKAEL